MRDLTDAVLWANIFCFSVFVLLSAFNEVYRTHWTSGIYHLRLLIIYTDDLCWLVPVILSALLLIDFPMLKETLRHLIVLLILTNESLSDQIYDFITTACWLKFDSDVYQHLINVIQINDVFMAWLKRCNNILNQRLFFWKIIRLFKAYLSNHRNATCVCWGSNSLIRLFEQRPVT